MLKIVLDTSIIINGKILRLIESNALNDTEIIIPEVVIDELQSQASQKHEQGFVGLEEIKKIKDVASVHNLQIRFEGKRPTVDDIKLSGRGRIDAIIKDMAKQNNAVLYTSDKVQSIIADVEGISNKFIQYNQEQKELEFLKFVDSTTMSIHLKEGLVPKAKKGKPGSFVLTEIGNTILTRDYLHYIATQMLEISKIENSGIEISKPGALVIQYQDYRIAITQPPFSENYEITIVHPIVKLALEDYNISEKLMLRLSKKAEGILISGSPGSGKSTLASGLANFYHNKGKIVKTFESPRDLQVDAAITQYTKLDGSFENTADILLLVRPDYTIFDEVRRKEDFSTFADLRMTGVGMVGVIHASSPLDAIQRFIGKIDLGIIPSVLDTVVFVKDGNITIVYDLELKIKVPSGMTEQDLARPVIEIHNFENSQLEYEIYTFGEENIIVPVLKKTSKTGIEKLAEEQVRDVFKRFDPKVKVEVLTNNSVKVIVDKQCIAGIIGRGGSNISELEKMLKVHIDVVEKNSSEATENSLYFTFSESKTVIILTVDHKYAGMFANISAGGDHITTIRIGKKGQIKLPKRAEVTKQLTRLAPSQNDIQIVLKNF